MFQDYQFQKLISFSNPIKRLVMSQNGTIITQTRAQIIITHTKGCNNPIELISYIRSELKMTDRLICRGISSIPLNIKEQNSSCFGLIINSSFWLIVVSIIGQNDKSLQLQLDRVKLMNFSENEHFSSLHFIQVKIKNRTLIVQKMKDGSINVIDIESYQRLSGNFSYRKLNNLKLGRKNDQQLGDWSLLQRSNLIYSIVNDQKEDKLVVTHQLSSRQTENIKIYIYGLVQTNQNQTFAQNCSILPTFQDQTMLVDILFVPTSQKSEIQKSYLLLIYQRQNGIEIVETNYHASNTIIRKHLYPDIHFLQLIASSIVPQEIYLKGIESCIQNHTILIQTSKGISQNHQLTLLSLPSTGHPKIINQKQSEQQFEYCKNGKDGIWVSSSNSLTYIKIIKKAKIYETMLKLHYPQQINHLHTISNEMLQFLQ